MKLKSKHTKIERVLCSEDWKDSDITIEDNVADISQEEVKKAYCARIE